MKVAKKRKNRPLQPFAALAITCGAVAAESDVFARGGWFSPPDLRVELQNAAESPEAGEQWQKACKTIGRTLQVGHGPMGMGVFEKWSCASQSGNNRQARRSEWLLTVATSNESLNITIFGPETGGGRQTMATVSLPGSNDSLRFLGDTEFADLVAMVLLDQLPVSQWITAPSRTESSDAKKKTDSRSLHGPFASSDGRSIRGRFLRSGGGLEPKFEVPSPPKALVVYRVRLDRESDLWRSRVEATATLKSSNAAPKHELRKSRGDIDAVRGVHVWTVSDSPTVSTSRLRHGLWVHNANGRGSRQQELLTILTSAQKSLAEASSRGDLDNFMRGGIDALTSALMDTAASGYLGFRYGKQVLAGDELLDKTSFFGFLTEIRGGPLEGLRFYYDLLPKVSADRDGFGTEISWSRFILGKSFGLELDGIIDRIDVTPKIGMWNLSATLPSVLAEDNKTVTRVQTFGVKRALSLGLEPGIESKGDWYLMRVWAAYDIALSIGALGGGGVQSYRYGFDGYFTASPSIDVFGVPVSTAILAFFFFESIDLTDGQGKETTSDSTDERIVGVGYDGGYAGLGVVLSW